MDFASLFAQFGYPALVSGALIWIMQGRLEKIRLELEQANLERRETNLRLDRIENLLSGKGSAND